MTVWLSLSPLHQMRLHHNLPINLGLRHAEFALLDAFEQGGEVGGLLRPVLRGQAPEGEVAQAGAEGAQGMQGVARVRVTIDANGHVLGRDLVQSSGRPLLDQEALAMMQRSDPFPRPPPGMPNPIVLTVPVNFAIR